MKRERNKNIKTNMKNGVYILRYARLCYLNYARELPVDRIEFIVTILFRGQLATTTIFRGESYLSKIINK